MIKELTCICCPMGCALTVEVEGDKVVKVEGNTCKRGADYAVSEITAPTRVVTTTVISVQGRPVPVKTAVPIPKDKIFEVTEKIKSAEVSLPVNVGDVIIEDLYGSPIVVCAKVG
ncbi:MAG: DUF1667 domain-containing protein [Ruminococcus sp.]|nr:DUF1667 domain-containing protein [Ruminococcus sp.]